MAAGGLFQKKQRDDEDRRILVEGEDTTLRVEQRLGILRM
jgi:hypothetical protein